MFTFQLDREQKKSYIKIILPTFWTSNRKKKKPKLIFCPHFHLTGRKRKSKFRVKILFTFQFDIHATNKNSRSIFCLHFDLSNQKIEITSGLKCCSHFNLTGNKKKSWVKILSTSWTRNRKRKEPRSKSYPHFHLTWRRKEKKKEIVVSDRTFLYILTSREIASCSDYLNKSLVLFN